MFLTKNKDKTEGFTLIELMIVIVIIGILVSIALPNFVAAQERAKMASLKSNIRTLRIVSETYSVDWGGNPAQNVTVLHAVASSKGYWKELKNPFTGQSGFGFAVSVYNTPIMGVINPFSPLMFANAAVSDSQNQQDSAPPLPSVVFVNSNGENVPGLTAYFTEISASQNSISKYYIVGSIKKKDGTIGYLGNKGEVYYESNGGNDGSNGGNGGGSNGGNNNPNPNPSGSVNPNPYPTSPSGYVSPNPNPYPSSSVNPNPYPTSPSGYVSPTPFSQTFMSPTDLTGSYYYSGSTPPTTQQLINPAPNTQLNYSSPNTGTYNYTVPQ